MTTVGYVLFFVLFVILAVVAVGIVVFDIRLNTKIDRIKRLEAERNNSVEVETDELCLRVSEGKVKISCTASELSAVVHESKDQNA